MQHEPRRLVGKKAASAQDCDCAELLRRDVLESVELKSHLKTQTLLSEQRKRRRQHARKGRRKSHRKGIASLKVEEQRESANSSHKVNHPSSLRSLGEQKVREWQRSPTIQLYAIRVERQHEEEWQTLTCVVQKLGCGLARRPTLVANDRKFVSNGGALTNDYDSWNQNDGPIFSSTNVDFALVRHVQGHTGSSCLC